MNIFGKKKRIFLDYASTTPVLPEVKRAMEPFFLEQFGNPSALYQEGVEAKRAVDDARKSIARTLGAHPDEIIFTGSGTESANLATFGVFNAYRGKKAPHIIMSAFEHPSVKETVEEIKRLGGEVSVLSPDEAGLISPLQVKEVLKENTLLVSILYANNEIGTIQPIKEIAKVIRDFRLKQKQPIYFHTDASQAPNYLSLGVPSLGVDLMTLDASKIYGPKGVGVLYAKESVSLSPIIHGGGQEGGKRSGTENVSLIVGMARALSLAVSDREKESKRLTILRDETIAKILSLFPDASLNGSEKERLSNNINICFPGIDAEFGVLALDAAGIAVSYASSCRTLAERSSSYVIEAIGKPECTSSSLRFTLGRSTTRTDIQRLLEVLPKVVSRAKISL